ncbi:MAG TPA: indole-3-glycerol-phosphate synthase [Thermoanaerobaculia bacterium]|jgi:indole-3-glycerol phosphate synthase|nr:indole-3-glycerol-phosphate synthase [Thermoanaerobaculia bacterium]
MSARATGDVLDAILAAKRARLAGGPPPAPASGLPSDGAAFVRALREPGVRVIAEIKAKSPSAGEILHGADGKIETFALHYRRGHAAAISVVTEQDFFGGDPEWVARAKRISGRPILMKDFFVAPEQLDAAAALGADAVLLIVRALAPDELARLRERARSLGLAVVAETHSADEIRAAAAVAPDVLGINARDLATFETDLEKMAALASAVPAGPVKLAESGIRSRDDVARLLSAGLEAFLVGESLLRSEDPEGALRALQA